VRTLTASVEIEIPFHDVDAMNVAWHGHYLKYFELARCALLRRLKYDYPQMRDSGYFWPIVECHLKYVRPARYGQLLQVAASLVEHQNRLKIQYVITDLANGYRLTEGYTVQVAVEAGTGELQFVSPPILLEKIEQACARPL